MTQRWLLLDFDDSQMATEHLALPSLIQRFNELYGDQIKHHLTLEEFKEHFHGQAREILCTNLSEYFGIGVDYPTLYESRDWNVMQMLQQRGAQMAPHLIGTLELLQSRGYRFAFVSNNSIQRGLASMRYATNGQGEKLAHFFGTAFFEAGEIQKPKPDVYLMAMAQLGTSPHHCFAVEDSPSGVSSAVGARIKTFGFLGFADDPEKTAHKLIKRGAVACIKDWRELPSLLPDYNLT